MLLVLWTLYSVGALVFRAVSTKSCGVLFVFGPKLAVFGILKSGQTGRTFSLFSWIGYNGLPEYFGFFFFFFVYVGLKFVIFGILKSGQTGRTFSLFFRIGYNDLPEYYCTRYELESIAVHAVSFGCWGFRTCFCRGQSRIFQVKRRLREAIVYLGGCNCQPRQRNRNETSPSLLGDREGRARPGDRNTCVNKYDSKGN